ncbi:MAG TPA: excinuclease ABC subunit UvrC, partial [Armatimonadota bacterium]
MTPIGTPLRDKLRTLPDKPGCYVYRDEAGTVIYVGKAINLRNRVRSYFQAGARHTPKTERLVSRIWDLEIYQTDSELEALILECTLIKRYRPYFNIRLRDDKQYPYLKLTLNEEFPRLVVTRQAHKDGNRYFGPYTNSGAVNETLSLIRQVFGLRSCSLTFTGHEGIRPCLYYHIKQCVAPCDAQLCTREEYLTVVEEVVLFLEGKQERLLKRLERMMEQEAEALNFERAARLRDQVQAVQKIIERQKVISTALGDQDVIAVVSDDGRACAQMFYVRGGKLIGQEHFFLEGATDESLETSVQDFVKQYYQDAPFIPKEVLLQTEFEEYRIIESWLRQKKGKRVELLAPKRGEKRKLVEMAATNASLALKQAAAQVEERLSRAQQAMDQLQEELELPSPPTRIECYDISNIQGTEAVGSMVVAAKGEPKKSDYRRFRIRGLPAQPNDFLMMQQVLRRRLEKAQAGDAKFLPLPDLIVVDGGKGQLSVSVSVLKEMGMEIPIVGLAKEHELVFRPGES